ncbi:hypothetical protein HAX54_025595 [Datura stramonium]|uniref:Uncharacterized protein n=1 Tax=Datura stramonium TaxID=4076 RepID=A0ABS8V0C5_DATST|nr:hypothetical protein [Datura stramonium]
MDGLVIRTIGWAVDEMMFTTDDLLKRIQAIDEISLATDTIETLDSMQVSMNPVNTIETLDSMQVILRERSGYNHCGRTDKTRNWLVIDEILLTMDNLLKRLIQCR